MITGELKNRIDSLWEIFWTGVFSIIYPYA